MIRGVALGGTIKAVADATLTGAMGASAGPGVARIILSAATVAENASVGTTIGTLSVASGSGSYTFTITADPDSKFTITGAALKTNAALNYEAATSHSVTIEADNGVDDPISRTITIFVTNVLEVTLAALTLSADEIEEESPEDTVVGAIQNKSSGSTLSLTDSAGNRFKLSGTNIVAGSVATDFEGATSHDITLRETHADASNTPRDTVLTIEVTAISAGLPEEDLVLALFADTWEVISGRAVIWNEATDVPPSPNLLLAPNMKFEAGFWNKTNCSLSDANEEFSDATELGSTLDGAGSWSLNTGFGANDIPAGTYTSAHTIQRNDTTDQPFAIQIGADVSSAKTGLATVSRATHTAVLGGAVGDTTIRLQHTGGANAKLLIKGFELFQGSSDLHQEPAGHIITGLTAFTQVPTYASGLLNTDVSGFHGAVELAAPLVVTNCSFFAAVVKTSTASGSNISVLSVQGSAGVLDFDTEFEGVPGLSFNGNIKLPWLSPALWEHLNDGMHVIGWTILNGNEVRFWQNGMMIGAVTGVSITPSTIYWLQLCAQTGQKFGGLVLYSAGKSDEICRTVQDIIAARMTTSGNAPNEFTPVYFEGDSNTGRAICYPYLYRAAAASPVLGVNAGTNGAQLITLMDSARVQAIIDWLPADRPGVFHVMIGTNGVDGFDGSDATTFYNTLVGAGYLGAIRAARPLIKIGVGCVLPLSGNTAHEAKRQTFNGMVRAGPGNDDFDFYSDCETDPRIGAYTAFIDDPEYWDAVDAPPYHLNADGQALLLAVVKAAIDPQLNP